MTREIDEEHAVETLDRVMRDLRALGYDGADLSGLDPDKPGFHDFRGQETEVLCEHRRILMAICGNGGNCGPPRKLQDKSQLRGADRLPRGSADAGPEYTGSDASDE